MDHDKHTPEEPSGSLLNGSFKGPPRESRSDPGSASGEGTHSRRIDLRTGTRRHYVLVVDGDEMTTIALKRLLGYDGFDVDVAATADEALRTLSGREPEVLLTDVRVPGMSGRELTRIVRRDFPRVVVVQMTAEADSAVRDGAHASVRKPLDAALAAALFRRLLAAS